MITQDELKDQFEYDRDTGKFIRKEKSGNAAAGSEAGSISAHGYMRIMINKHRYMSHHLAWLYVYGVLPKYPIQHINKNLTDNRISNLREVIRARGRRREAVRNAPQHETQQQPKDMITQEELKQQFKYNEDTGTLTRIKIARNASTGYEDVSIDTSNYQRVKVNKRRYLTHHLVWLYVYGVLPKYPIEHIDNDSANNRISNLREMIPETQQEQQLKGDYSVMRNIDMITQNIVQDTLDYNPDTGVLTWRPRTSANINPVQLNQWNAKYAGKRAGELGLISGKIRSRITLFGQKVSLLRIAWIHSNGNIDEYDEIYPANGDKTDLRLCNLVHRRVNARLGAKPAPRRFVRRDLADMVVHYKNTWVTSVFGIVDNQLKTRLNEKRGEVHRSGFLHAAEDEF